MSTDVERREIRRRKILENAENRMKRIIYSEASPENEPAYEAKKSLNSDNDSCGFQKTKRLNESTESPSIDCLNGNSPKYVPLYNKQSLNVPKTFYRLWVSVIFGILLRLIFLKFSNINFFVVFMLYEIGLEIVGYFSTKESKLYPNHGLIVDFFLSFGFSERFVIRCGKFTEATGRIFSDFVLILFAFILCHILVK